MIKKYTKQLFNVLENSPYHADKLRFFWQTDKEERMRGIPTMTYKSISLSYVLCNQIIYFDQKRKYLVNASGKPHNQLCIRIHNQIRKYEHEIDCLMNSNKGPGTGRTNEIAEGTTIIHQHQSNHQQMKEVNC